MASTCTQSRFLSLCQEGDVVKIKEALDEVRSDPSAINDLLNCTSYPYHDWMPELGGGKLFDFKPLHYACAFGHHEVARMLVDAGSRIDWAVRGTMAGNITLLHLASFFVGNIDLIKFLLSVGGMSMINAQSSNGVTPLMMAALGGHDMVTRLLVEAGAAINVQSHNGKTPLIIAVQGDHFEAGIVLVNAGADLNLQDKCGQTVLMKTLYALDQRTRRGVYSWKNERRQREVGFYLEQVRMLVESGAQVNVRDKRGQTALMMVIYMGYDEIVTMLLEAGADVNIQDNNGRNALMIALNEENLEVARMLVDAGAHINVQDNDGETALMMAVCPAKKEVYNGKDRNEEYGYYYLSTKKDAEEGFNLEQVSALLGAGALVDLQNKEGETALIKSAQIGDAKLARALLDAGAKEHFSDKTCWTAMKWARERQHRSVVKLFRGYQQSKRGAAAPATAAAQPPAPGAPKAHPGPPSPAPPPPPCGSGADGELDALGRVFQEALGAARAQVAAAAAASAEEERGKACALEAELAECRGELARVLEKAWEGARARDAAEEAARAQEQGLREELKKLRGAAARAREVAEEAARAQERRLREELAKAREELVKARAELKKLRGAARAREVAEAELGRLKGERLGEMGLAEAEGLERDLQGFLAAAKRRREALVKEQLENAAASAVCVVCQENGKSVLTLPCRHLCLCQGCSENEQLKVCPLCRTEIESKIQTFL